MYGRNWTHDQATFGPSSFPPATVLRQARLSAALSSGCRKNVAQSLVGLQSLHDRQAAVPSPPRALRSFHSKHAPRRSDEHVAISHAITTNRHVHVPSSPPPLDPSIDIFSPLSIHPCQSIDIRKDIDLGRALSIPPSLRRDLFPTMSRSPLCSIHHIFLAFPRPLSVAQALPSLLSSEQLPLFPSPLVVVSWRGRVRSFGVVCCIVGWTEDVGKVLW